MNLIKIFKKHLVLICLMTSIIFIVIAALKYPGGSPIDKSSVGFQWTKNFFSNLFTATAINGAVNKGRVWATIAMLFHSIGYGIFFINMSNKVPSNLWARLLKWIGIANIVLIFLIATPLHDLGTLSIALTLVGLFSLTILIMKSTQHLLKIVGIFCLTTYYVFFLFYGLGYLELIAITQKVYTASSMLFVLGLEYFSHEEDFSTAKKILPKIETRNP